MADKIIRNNDQGQIIFETTDGGTPQTAMVIAADGSITADIAVSGVPVNYVSNSDAEGGTGGWTMASGAVLDDTATVGEVLRGSKSFRFSGASGGTFETTLTIEEADANKLMRLSFDQKALGTYAAGNLSIELVDPSSNVITPRESAIPGGQGLFQTDFASAEKGAYTLRFTLSATLSVANAIVLDDINVNAGSIVTGAVVGAWQSFTPTWVGLPTPTSEKWSWRRIGSSMEINGDTKMSGAVTGQINLSIPESLTIDTINIDTTAIGRHVFGTGHALRSSFRLANIGYASSTSVLFTDNSGSFWAAADPAVWASGDIISASFTVPVAEWAGSGTVNLGANDVEYAFNTSTSTSSDTTDDNYGHGPSGTLIKNFAPTGLSAVIKRIQFTSPIAITDDISLEVTADLENWVPFDGRLAGFATNDAGSIYYGPKLIEVTGSDTKMDVYFYSQSFAGVAWSVVNTFKWRVKKTRAGVAVGFGLATAENAGLVSREESGTWTPAYGSDSNLTSAPTFTGARYHRFGNLVMAEIDEITGMTLSAAAGRTYLSFTSSGLPGLTNSTQFGGSAMISNLTANRELTASIQSTSGSSTKIFMAWDPAPQGSNGDSLHIYGVRISYTMDE